WNSETSHKELHVHFFDRRHPAAKRNCPGGISVDQALVDECSARSKRGIFDGWPVPHKFLTRLLRQWRQQIRRRPPTNARNLISGFFAKDATKSQDQGWFVTWSIGLPQKLRCLIH